MEDFAALLLNCQITAPRTHINRQTENFDMTNLRRLLKHIIERNNWDA